MVLLFKLGIAMICGAAYVTLSRSNLVASLSERRFQIFIALLWLITRLGLYVIAFLILKMAVTSDVMESYYPEGQKALLGGLVYRDFSSSYSPGFAYLLTPILLAWNSPKAIVLASILIEGVTLAVWLRVARDMWPGQTGRLAALAYTLSALVILDVAVAGQNQTWVGLLLGAAVLLYKQKRPLWAALVSGLPVVLIKFLPLLYVAAFLRWRARPFRAAAAALLLPAAVFGILVFNGVDVAQPIHLQAPLVTSGSLAYLASWAVSLNGGPAQMTSLLVLAVFALYLLTRPAELTGHQIVFGLVILTLACALANKKFFTTYLVMVSFPLSIVAAMDAPSLPAAVRFGVFNMTAALEPSLWFRLFHADEYSSQLWQLVPQLQQVGELWKLWAFIGVELLLISFYVYYLVAACRFFQESLELKTARSVNSVVRG